MSAVVVALFAMPATQVAAKYGLRQGGRHGHRPLPLRDELTWRP